MCVLSVKVLSSSSSVSVAFERKSMMSSSKCAITGYSFGSE